MPKTPSPFLRDITSYYLAPPSEQAKQELMALADDKSFFFAPFNNPLQKYEDPRVAATLVFGSRHEGDVATVVRQRTTDEFMGLVRFTNIQRIRNGNPGFWVELSYMVRPQFQYQGYGRSAVLQALDWYINANEIFRKRGARIWATLDPEPERTKDQGVKAFHILKIAGLTAQKYFDEPKMALQYLDDFSPERAARFNEHLYTEGKVRSVILNALQKARDERIYVPVDASVSAALPKAIIPNIPRRGRKRRTAPRL